MRAPRPLVRLVLRIFAILIVLASVALAGSAVLGRLPVGTDAGSIVVRAATGLAFGVLIALVVRRVLGALTEPPPPSPPVVDARSTEVVYECQVCGTRLRLELAATAKAPRHCGEEMASRIVDRD